MSTKDKTAYEVWSQAPASFLLSAPMACETKTPKTRPWTKTPVLIVYKSDKAVASR